MLPVNFSLRGVMISFLFVFQLFCVATVLPVAYIFISGTRESRSHEIRYIFQGLSSIDCNFQGLFKALNFYFQIQGLSRRAANAG